MTVSSRCLWQPIETNNCFHYSIYFKDNQLKQIKSFYRSIYGETLTNNQRSSRQILPIITNRGILLRNLVNISSFCIRKSLLYGYKSWPATSKTIHCLTSVDNGMVRWICDVQLEQHITTQELRKNLGIISVSEEIGWRSLRNFNRLQRMGANVWPRGINNYVIPGNLLRGHPQLLWSDVTTKDFKF